MTNFKPKTEEGLLDLLNGLIEMLSDKEDSGLREIDYLQLKRAVKEADKIKKDNWAAYYEIMAYVEACKGNYKHADSYFKKASNLNKSNHILEFNHQLILLASGKFEEVEEWLLGEYASNNVEEGIARILFQTSLVNLDFKNFKEYITTSYNQLSLLFKVDEAIKQVSQLEKLGCDIENIGLNKSLFKQAMVFIYSFYRKITREPYYPFLKIDTSDMSTLIVELFLNIDVDKAVKLTSDFEEAFVDFAIEQDNMDLLRKFSVFIKPSSLLDLDKEYPMYAGINKNWVV